MTEQQDKVRVIFAGAVARPLEERRGWLEAECGGDVELLHQVEELLGACHAADEAGFLNSPTGGLGAPRSAATDATSDSSRSRLFAPLTERAGTRIGPYKLLELLGEGGFGAVFVAEQEKPVRRRVALKIIKLGMDTRQVVARFEQERQALAVMDHPNIARVLDAGATESGRPYFVMELVKGVPITEYCDRHKLSVAQRLELFVQVCNAVQHAHQKGVIHRDIKPRNVLVSTQDDKPLAKVIDFGIAKATDRSLTDMTIYTEHRSFVGTPEYMSPEQAEGSLDVDTRADVYSLGVLLYELLTGATPFSERDLHRAAFAEIQRIIREVEPVQPSTRLTQSAHTIGDVAQRRASEPRLLGTLVRGELDWISMKALEKDRVRRYDSASALAQDVQRHLSGEPVVAAPPSTAYRMRKFVRRHRGPVVATSTVAAALLVGMAGMAWLWWKVDAANSELESANEELLAREQIVESGMQFFAKEAIDPDGWTVGGLRITDHPDGPKAARREELAQILDCGKYALQERRKQRDAARRSAYVANLALAQAEMAQGNWPEARKWLLECPESQRGWEWTFLSERANDVVMEISGARCAAFNHDGTRLVTGTRSGTVRVWDTSTWTPLGEPIMLQHQLFSVAIDPSGTRALTIAGPPFGSEKFATILELWDVASGKLSGELARCDGYRDIRGTFSPEGRLVAVMGGGIAPVWDAATRQPVADTAQPPGATDLVALSENGVWLVSSLSDGTMCLCLWDADAGTWKPTGKPTQQIEHIASVSVSQGGRLAALTSNATSFLWDTATATICPLGEPVTNGGHCLVAISPDGARVAVAACHYIGRSNSPTKVQLWDTTTKLPVGESMRCDDHNFVDSISFNPDAKLILSLSSSGAFLWDTTKCSPVTSKPIHFGNWAHSATFSPDGTHLLMVKQMAEGSGEDGVWVVPTDRFHHQTRVIDAQDLQLERQALLGDTRGLTLTGNRCVKADGRMLRLHTVGAQVKGDIEPDRAVAAIPVDEPAMEAVFTPDGTQLLVTLASGTGIVLDSRPATASIADLAERHAERRAARELVDQLLAAPPGSPSYVPTDKLDSTIRADASLTPIRRLAATHILTERFVDHLIQARAQLAVITKDATDAAAVRAAAAALDLPPRVKEIVVANAAEWDYQPPDPNAEERLAQETRTRRLQEAELLLRDPTLYGQDQLDACNRAHAVRLELLGPAHMDTVHAARMAAITMMDPTHAINRREGGLQLYEQALSSYTASGGAPTWELALYMFDLALLKRGGADGNEGAVRLIESALTKLRQAPPPDRKAAMRRVVHDQIGNMVNTPVFFGMCTETSNPVPLEQLLAWEMEYAVIELHASLAQSNDASMTAERRKHHLSAGRAALAECRALMADPAYARTWNESGAGPYFASQAEALLLRAEQSAPAKP